MTVGSLVECINDNFRKPASNIKMPVKGCIYTVCGMKEWPLGLGIYLAELESETIRVLYPNGKVRTESPPFNYKHFRELLPPIDIEKEITYQELIPS